MGALDKRPVRCLTLGAGEEWGQFLQINRYLRILRIVHLQFLNAVSEQIFRVHESTFVSCFGNGALEGIGICSLILRETYRARNERQEWDNESSGRHSYPPKLVFGSSWNSPRALWRSIVKGYNRTGKEEKFGFIPRSRWALTPTGAEQDYRNPEVLGTYLVVGLT